MTTAIDEELAGKYGKYAGSHTESNKISPQDLGNGLLLRQAMVDDIAGLVEFNSRMQYQTYGISIQDLFAPPESTIRPRDGSFWGIAVDPFHL